MEAKVQAICPEAAKDFGVLTMAREDWITVIEDKAVYIAVLGTIAATNRNHNGEDYKILRTDTHTSEASAWRDYRAVLRSFVGNGSVVHFRTEPTCDRVNDKFYIFSRLSVSCKNNQAVTEVTEEMIAAGLMALCTNLDDYVSSNSPRARDAVRDIFIAMAACRQQDDVS